jgi:hypothetical protein
MMMMSDILLAWVNHRLEAISESQHRLALQKTVLQQQATRLRLGVPASDVEIALTRVGIQVPPAARSNPRARHAGASARPTPATPARGAA